jgi:hypothetical protein
MENKSKAILRIYLEAVEATLKVLHPATFTREQATVTRYFLLGVMDFLRQANKIQDSEFLELYSWALDKFQISRPESTAELISFLYQQMKENEELEEIVRLGAGSIVFWTAKSDSSAAMDLLSLVKLVEKD